MGKESKKGRPTKYKEEYNEQAYKLCLLGFTNSELASFFEVNESTIERWMQKYSDFCGSVTRGKVIADGNVAQAFYKRALGYNYIERREKDDGDSIEITTTDKHIPADPGAAMNWLSNRQRSKWCKAPKISVEVKTDSISDVELDERIKQLQERVND